MGSRKRTGCKMRIEKVVDKLSQLYGANVKVNNAYHIQVLSDKGPHDIWVKKGGSIKFKRAGSPKIFEGISLQGIIQKIGSNKKTTVEKMRDMLSLAEIVAISEKAVQTLGDAIFTDAGFKEGRARIAAVKVNGDEIEAKSLKNVERVYEIRCIQDAEKAAIEYGLSLDPDLIVYNDNKPVCEALNNPRVKWLPRENLKAPDKLASMKGR
jgi:hypothetical protein